MSLTYLLAMFVLLAIACFTYFAAARFKIPYTVLLVAVGLALVPLTQFPMFAFLKDFQLTPELLFYIFLPILIFESAYNIKVKNIQENIVAISLLSVFSLIISTVFIAVVLHVILGLLGLQVAPIILLLFGALISATDPVAVLALFKEYGAPKRLSLIFEGESLFNDGTAVALFLIFLEIAHKGYHGVATIGEGVFLFVSMVVGGVVFGLFMGGLFAKMIEATRSNENVSIILMLVLAHVTFILSEIISHHVAVAGLDIKVSAIIATTIASIVMGNYGRYKVAPKAEEFVDKFWGQFAFMINSLVFILMGLLFAALPIQLTDFIIPIAVAIVVVAVGRALSIYPVIGVLNWLKLEKPIPTTWQNLLAWGSLRGALAITMVLLIPDAWRPEGWAYAYSPKDFIMALTIGCIYATLFIKALTIGPMIKKTGLNALSEVEKLEYRDAARYVHGHMLERLETLKGKGYIDATGFDHVHHVLKNGHEASQKRFKASHKANLVHAAVNIHALGIERYYLHDLFANGELNDRIMRRIQALIAAQLDILEQGGTLGMHPGSVKGDWLDLLVDAVHKQQFWKKTPVHVEQFLYYRAKVIITRKVIKEMKLLSSEQTSLFSKDDVAEVIERYQNYHRDAEKKIADLIAAHGAELTDITNALALLAAEEQQQTLLDELLERELISPKVHISLRNKLQTTH
jgi:monovalent cation:H+ antiporter, CPA1 family